MIGLPAFVGIYAILAASEAIGRKLQARDCSITWPAYDGDDCAAFADSWSISEAQFLSYNPGAVCSALVVGKEYCVEWSGTPPPLPETPKPTPTPTPTPVVTPTPTTLSSVASPKTTPATPATTCASTPAGVVTPSPIQSGMTCGCTKFYKIASGDGCWQIANNNGISLENLYAWNPANADCQSVFPGDYICVAKGAATTTIKTTPSPTPSVFIPPLLCTFDPKKGEYVCPTAPPTPTPTPVKNPAPGPTQEGIAAKCNKWVLQKDGVYCFDMAKTAGIALDRLYLLNPALKGDCSGLWPKYAYCIGTS